MSSFGSSFKHSLEESERRILAELHKIKDELLQEMRGIASKTQVVEDIPSEAFSGSPLDVMKVSNKKFQSVDDLDRKVCFDSAPSERVTAKDSSASGATALSSKSFAFATPADPDAVMGSTYASLLHEERRDVHHLSQNPSSLSRFVCCGFTTQRLSDAHPESGFLAGFVAGQIFDSLASVLVAMNAIYIGIEVNMKCVHRSATPGIDNIFFVGDMAFLILCFVEWLLRVTVNGLSFFSCKNKAYHWNWLDTISLLLQVVDQVVDSFHHLVRDSPVVLLASLRVIRVLRIFRIVRLLHLSDQLGMLVQASSKSLSSVSWALVFMLTIMYGFSVTFTHIVWTVKRGDVDGALAYWFNNVPRTMLTLTEAVLGGVSWDEPVALLFSEVGRVWGVTFVIFVFLGYFILINIVTGIFTDGVAKSAEQEASRQMALQLQDAMGIEELHSSPDSQQHLSDEITWEEFRHKVLADESMKDYFLSIDIEPTEASARKLFDLLDLDQSRALTKGEVFYGCLKMREPARFVDVSLLKNQLAEVHKGIEYLILNTRRIKEKAKSEQRP